LRHRSILLCAYFVKFRRREIGEIVRYLPDQKIRLPLKLSVGPTARIAPKTGQGQPQQCTQSAADFIEIGSPSVEL